jgi:hypothetical protein
MVGTRGMSQAVPNALRAGTDGAAWWRSSLKAALAGGWCGRLKPGRVKRGKRGLPRGEWARLLSRLHEGATETNDYPGLPESQSVTGRTGLVTL